MVRKRLYGLLIAAVLVSSAIGGACVGSEFDVAFAEEVLGEGGGEDGENPDGQPGDDEDGENPDGQP
ncbi:MAG: hypothetical protein J6Y86_04030, partial [Pseudobutyrivibrio sp.]|nr:hypothetical protein [Pseudobutyrivibrio sp.]